jgi:NDP-sugar pyrophosphorylase family protein
MHGSVINDMKLLKSEDQFESFDLMGDVIKYLVDRKDKVAAFMTEAFWYDVGSIERYQRLSNDRISKELDYLL